MRRTHLAPTLADVRQPLLDTNILIDYLTGKEPYLSLVLPLFRRIQRGECAAFVSVVTEAELLIRPEEFGDTAAIQRVADLLSENGFYVIEADRRIARRAARLRGRENIGLADAIIAATAIETGCDAIVTNDRDFAKRLREIPYISLNDLI